MPRRLRTDELRARTGPFGAGASITPISSVSNSRATVAAIGRSSGAAAAIPGPASVAISAAPAIHPCLMLVLLPVMRRAAPARLTVGFATTGCHA